MMTNNFGTPLGVTIFNFKDKTPKGAEIGIKHHTEKKIIIQQKKVLLYSLHLCIIFSLKIEISWFQVFSLGKREFRWTSISIREYIRLGIDRTNSLFEKKKKKKNKIII